MEEIKRPQQKLPNQEIDYIKILKVVWSRWYLIAGSVAVCYGLALMYLWYMPKTYATGSTLKFEDKKSEIADLISVPGTTDRTTVSKIQSETIVLQSMALITNAVKQLDYRISYYVVGRVLGRTNELYPEKPLQIDLVKFDSLNFYHDLITFKSINDVYFNISHHEGGKEVISKQRYNKPFTIGPTSFSIKHPKNLPQISVILFKLNAPEDFYGRVRGGLRATETAKNSNIISLTESDENPKFAADILNAIMKQYLIYDVGQRTQSASQMIRFIDSQLDFLAGELKRPDTGKNQTPDRQKVFSVTSNSERIMSKATNLESQVSLFKIDIVALNQLRNEVAGVNDAPLPNFNLGTVEQSQANMAIANLNNLIADRKVALKTYRLNSDFIRDIDQKILQIKNDLINSINATHSLIENKIRFIQTQLNPVNRQIAELPAAQRELVSLQRDFEINNKVYSMLSEKKLGAQITMAGILPGASIIDLAQPNMSPIAPNEDSVIRLAEMLGLAIGVGLIILTRILNPYIFDKETIESLTSIPIIGVIKKYPEDIDEYSSQVLALSHPKSIFAESVRSVRTNLSFLASDKASKVICITSEIAGEGKSFVAINLSSTLGLIDKKVILIAADLRRSKLHKTFGAKNDVGLSSYLSRQCEMEAIILRTPQQNLDVIVSGPVPPNPSELLHSARMTELIENLKKIYDVIMIDTAPIGLVSDAIPLIRACDVNLFVIRAGKSKYYAATVPQRIAQEYQLDNTLIILNAYKQNLLHSRYYNTKFTGDTDSRYYYYSDYNGYENSGYYTESEKKKWWSKWF